MNQNSMIKKFDKSIVKYFMDFIETDFHKRSAPKKKVVYTNGEGLTIGCNLSKFNHISDKISNLLNKKIDSEIFIKKGEYCSNLSDSLKDKAKELFRCTCESNIDIIHSNFINDIEEYLKIDVPISSTNKFKEDIFKSIIPLIKDSIIKKYFTDNVDFFVNNGIKRDELVSLEESLEKLFISYFDDNTFDLIEKCIHDPENFIKYTSSFISYDSFRDVLDDFLDILSVNDLYFELVKMNTSKNMLENKEFYLSIFDITYDSGKYPLFNISFSLEELKNTFKIVFGSQLYINKKALEYVIQEIKKESVAIGRIDSISERIIYLSDCQSPASKILQIVDDIMKCFLFKQSFNSDFGIVKSYKNEFINISNNLYFNIFDTSDDALVNDYEELLQALNSENSEIADFFESLICDFMTKEPISVNREIEDEWDNKNIGDRLVYHAPVPLNEEQIKILQAIGKKDCKYISVQGPPGTGKSHTITAIIFDMILKNKSVLVLSDKKEALDVVEDKITSTLNEVRVDSDFQNPVLRLGKSGGTYSKILSKSSIENIRISYKVAKNKKSQIEDKISKLTNTIKSDIEFEEENYNSIKLEDILELEKLDKDIKTKKINKYIDFKEFGKTKSSIEDLKSIVDIVDLYTSKENFDRLFEILDLYDIKHDNIELSSESLKSSLITIKKYNNTIDCVQNKYKNSTNIIKNYSCINSNDIDSLRKSIKHLDSVNTFFNKIFKKNTINNALKDVKKYYSDFNHNDRYLVCELEILFSIYDYICEKHGKIDSYDVVKRVIKDNAMNENLLLIQKLLDGQFDVVKFKQLYKNTMSNIDENNLFNISNSEELLAALKTYWRYVVLNDNLETTFNNIPISKYLLHKNELQSLITAKTAMIMDDRVIDFYDNNSNSAMTLKKIIQSKRKFPKNDFIKLKNAFPCILAGIRDYAEYIPLESNIFDLVIIDEASQVSIAQALPALIRAKKVLVLGDKKQFSNVKSSRAKTEINNEYKNLIKISFNQSEYSKMTTQTKLDYFDIKSSVLEFFEHISNYQAMLYKYFRGYDAIISYSNKYFYQDRLQVMKIRGKSINDVLKFEIIKHDGLKELRPKTNELEYKFIKNKILELLRSNYFGSIGIITPHTNQQRYIYSELRKLPEFNEMKKKFNLKVMTFDSCQGEERDTIFYSMVATRSDDKLYGVFPKSLDDIDLEEDGNLRAQRLNVGFSRAKECMYFVLSKNISEYSGEIGSALNFYKNYLEIGLKEKSVELTDKKSPQESMIMKYFYNTDFWKENSDSIDFMPQFELGKYLKQLDPSYNHPFYCVDFLLLYKQKDRTHKIIIEYDGFKEHFNDLLYVNKDNYNDYYKTEDIYRQKVLESYGYKFLRINKFNIGYHPSKELNRRLYEIVNEKDDDVTFANTLVLNDVKGIKDKTKKNVRNVRKY